MLHEENQFLFIGNHACIAGSPTFIEQDIANIQAINIADIQRVYDTYIKDKPYVATSFVPKGSLDLVAANSVKADVKEESIADATEVAQDIVDVEEEIEKHPPHLTALLNLYQVLTPWLFPLRSGQVN